MKETRKRNVGNGKLRRWIRPIAWAVVLIAATTYLGARLSLFGADVSPWWSVLLVFSTTPLIWLIPMPVEKQSRKERYGTGVV